MSYCDLSTYFAIGCFFVLSLVDEYGFSFYPGIILFIAEELSHSNKLFPALQEI